MQDFRAPGSSAKKAAPGALAIYFISVVLLVFLSASPAKSDTVTQEIQSLIQQQLQAFNEDDYFSAYQYASRHIQTEFTLTEFEMMVRVGYPHIAKSQKSSFEKIEVSKTGDSAIAIVHVTGKTHVTVIARYQLVYEEGSWRNNGVMILDQNTPI